VVVGLVGGIVVAARPSLARFTVPLVTIVFALGTG
jgi:hypothetical protein